ncbi:hypothetical protein GCM10010334_21790 [Streptomyces finlayi]|uniref:Alpha/beta hydrolase n=1 Tax=Streptomyces finlayi TaxID=67296 RepID=A0A919C8Z5_9ACTN|nr:hypothetical protein GCM10010334_21790 [Streptomyces finlayi]
MSGTRRNSPARSAGLLRDMLAPGGRPRPELVVGGEHDVFLPPRRLGPAVRSRLGIRLQVLADSGHLVVEECPTRLAALAG